MSLLSHRRRFFNSRQQILRFSVHLLLLSSWLMFLNLWLHFYRHLAFTGTRYNIANNFSSLLWQLKNFSPAFLLRFLHWNAKLCQSMLKEMYFIGFLEHLCTINIEKFSSLPNHLGWKFLGILAPSSPLLTSCRGPCNTNDSVIVIKTIRRTAGAVISFLSKPLKSGFSVPTPLK